MDELKQKPLAFSSDPSLVSASSRRPLETKDGAILNVEIFNESENSSSPILLLIHGVCASAETLGIQAIVAAAAKNSIRVAVLELEGHGLSSGKKGVCGDFDRLLNHALEFVSDIVVFLHKDDGKGDTPYYLAGNSLGGVLSIYAADNIAKNKNLYPNGFGGLAPIVPAVGVDPSAVPSAPIVMGLQLLALIAPSAQVPLTPLEDPTSYNCPSDTSRNFIGHWPLSTSKMLLDVTSNRVKTDLEEGNISLDGVPRVLFICGEDDLVVPFDAAKYFYEAVKPVHKQMLSVPKYGHDMMYHEVSAKIVLDALFEWINQ